MFADMMLSAIRKYSGMKHVKVYSWVSCSITAAHIFWGPSSPNKGRNLRALIQEEMERSGKPFLEAADAVQYQVLSAITIMIDVDELGPISR